MFGYDFKMLSDGKSLIFLDPSKDATIVASEFFVRSLSVNMARSTIDVTGLDSVGGYRNFISTLMEQTLTFDLAINGPIEYKQGGIIRSIFDLYSIRDLLAQVENKVNKRF